MNKRTLTLILGPVILLVTSFLLKDVISLKGAQAVGTLLWMIFWWIKRPVNMAVTGLMPVCVNALLQIATMKNVIANYSSEMIFLIFGASLLIMPWGNIGLDRRIALKCLSIVGPSMSSQIVVWLCVSSFLSTVLPNTVVAALLVPIACAMLKVAGYEDIKKSAPAMPILLALTWGCGIGGMGTPLGGMMNVTAINLIQEYTGVEVSYLSWIAKTVPFMLITLASTYVILKFVPNPVKQLEGTKDFFKTSYAELGPMKYEEKVCMVTFVLSIAAALLRPLYQSFLPALTPAYVNLILGTMNMFLVGKDKNPLLTWEIAQTKMLWSMMCTFAGGLAAGTLISESGAAQNIANIITGFNLTGGIAVIAIFVILIKLISETTSSTTGAAVVIPIMISFCQTMDINAVPYIMILVYGFSGIFVLPISWHAIAVGYGLNVNMQFKFGLISTLVNITLAVLVGYLFLQFWPYFSI